MEGFPSKIDHKTVKWYSDKGNYGKHMSYDIVYLAVVFSGSKIEVLFLDEYYRTVMHNPCDSEQEAMDIFDEPNAVTWHRMDAGTSNQKKVDFLFYFYNIIHKKINPVYIDVLFVSFMCFDVGKYILPHYGKSTLVSRLIVYTSMITLSLCLCVFLNRFVEYRKRVLPRTILRIISIIFLFGAAYSCFETFNVIMDFNDSTASVILTDSVYKKHHLRPYRLYRATEYIKGIYNGTTLSFDVTNINYSIASEIENKHPTIEVKYYRHSKAVKEIIILE